MNTMVVDYVEKESLVTKDAMEESLENTEESLENTNANAYFLRRIFVQFHRP